MGLADTKNVLRACALALGLTGILLVEESVGTTLFVGVSSETTPFLVRRALADPYLCFCLAQMVASGLALLWACRRKTFLSHAVAFAVAGGVMLLVPTGWAAAGSEPPFSVWLAIALFGCMVFGATLIKLMYLECIARLSIADLTRVVIGAVALQSLIYLPYGVVPSDSMALLTMVVVLIVAGLLPWLARSLPNVNLALTARYRVQARPTVSLVLGFAFVSVAVVMPLTPDMLEFTSSPLESWFVSRIPALAMLAVLLLGFSDMYYGTVFKVIVTLVLFAFGCYFAQVEEVAAATISTMALTLVEFVPMVAVLDLSTYSKTPPLVLCSAYLALFRGAQSIGLALSLGLPDFGVAGGIGVLAVFLLLVIAAVWLVNDRNLSLFFWRTPEGSGVVPFALDEESGEVWPVGEGAASKKDWSYEGAARMLSERYGLTDRENDVLALLIQGRTTPYIAEQLFVSNNTVGSHVSHIYAKCGVHSKLELMSAAHELAVE